MIVKCCVLVRIEKKGEMLRSYSKVAYFTHMIFLFLFQYDLFRLIKIRKQGVACFLFALVGTIVVFIGIQLLNKVKTQFYR